MQIEIFDYMLIYGRGSASIAEQIDKTKEEAQEIIDTFYRTFPKVKKWIDETIENAHKYGYVEDIAGRRRRLPDLLLDNIEVKLKQKDNIDRTFNPLLGCKGIIQYEGNDLIKEYIEKAKKIRSRDQMEQLEKQARADDIEIKSNTGFIAQAERQAVNSRVQGGAATLTKYAMLKIHKDERLKELGAYLINTVHDEIMIEVPEFYAEEAADRLSEIMIDAAKFYVPDVPMKCDAYIVSCWYLDEFKVLVEDEFKKLLAKGKTDIEAFESICIDRSESTRSQIYEIVGQYLSTIPENIDINYKSL